MVQYAMIIDLTKCVGCHSCSVACKAEWQVPSDSGRSWVKRLGPDSTPHGMAHTFYPGLCHHCDQPSCVPVCPVKKVPMKFESRRTMQAVFQDVAAIWKDPLNGTVQISQERCTSCGACVTACPYQAIYLDPKRGGKGAADKCSFCVELVAEGLQPACVATCPAGARIFGDRNDSGSLVAEYLRRGAQSLTSERVQIGPNVFYAGRAKDMYLLQKTCAPGGA